MDDKNNVPTQSIQQSFKDGSFDDLKFLEQLKNNFLIETKDKLVKNGKKLSLKKIKNFHLKFCKVNKKLIKNFHLKKIKIDELNLLNNEENINEIQLNKDEIDDYKVNSIVEAKEMVEKRKKFNGKLWSFIFLALNVAVIIAIIVMQANSEDGLSFNFLIESIGDRWWCLLLALLSFFCLMGCESIRHWLLIKKSTGHNRPFLSYKTSAMGLYYDNITPFSTGGQPFQIFYMMNRGVKGSVASGIPMACSIFGQLAFIVVGICVLIFSEVIAKNLPHLTYSAAVFGVIIQVLLVFFIVFVSISKKIAPFIMKGILKFLTKIRVIKNSNKTYDKCMGFINEYQLTMKYMITSIPTFLLTAIVSFLYICSNAGITFFICCAFVGFDAEMYGAVFILSVLIDLIKSYIPWPGATGVAEVSFAMLFGHELIGLSGEALVWAMLLWRVLTYYSFLFQGLIILLYDFLHGNKKIPKTIEKLKRLDMKKNIVVNKS